MPYIKVKKLRISVWISSICGFGFNGFGFSFRFRFQKEVLRHFGVECVKLKPKTETDVHFVWLLVAGRHLWSSVLATGGFGNLDTMLQETSHKWMAHAPYAATSKAESGLGRRMTRHIRLNQALEVTSLRSAPTTQKTALGRSGSLVGSNREVQVRFVGQGLVLHEPCGEGALNCWQKWHSLAAGGRPKSCRSQCGAPAVSGWLGRLKPRVSFKYEFRFQDERF